MISEPTIEYREEVPYVAIPRRVQMKEVPVALPPLIPEVYAWLAHNGIAPAGPLFFHYSKLTAGVLEVEVGVPIRTAIPGNGQLKPGLFPGGKYAVCTYQGDFLHLPQAHAAFEAWKAHQQLSFAPDRTEFYSVGPDTEPNPEKWRTEILIRVANE